MMLSVYNIHFMRYAVVDAGDNDNEKDLQSLMSEMTIFISLRIVMNFCGIDYVERNIRDSRRLKKKAHKLLGPHLIMNIAVRAAEISLTRKSPKK